MKSFAQFVAEPTNTVLEAHGPDVNPFGFLRPNGKPITKTGKDRGKWNHYNIAKKHGYADHGEAIRKNGWVRYEHLHHWQGLPPEVSHHAGYTYRPDTESKKTVAHHLRKSGGFDRIVLDELHPKGEIKSHEFKTNGQALEHLEKHLPKK